MPITFHDVAFTYSPHSPFEYAALRGINLTLDSHNFTAIVGHTGSGKSTLIQLTNGLLMPSKGAIAVDDQVILPEVHNYRKNLVKTAKNNPEAAQMLNFIKDKKTYVLKSVRRKIGIVFQFPEYQLFEETVEKDVAFGPLNFGVKKEEALKRAHEALKLVGLDESYFHRSPFELSGGERRRVAIAGIIAIHPDILILDEPTAGLDPLGAKMMMDLFADIYHQGTGLIMVTHDMDIVLRYADDVIVMKDGLVVKRADPVTLFGEDNEDYSLDIPMLYQVARRLLQAGYQFDIRQIKNEDDLAEAVARGRKH